MKLPVLFLVLIPAILVAGVVFEDNFENENDMVWVEWGSEYAADATYSVVDGQYHLVNSGSGWLPAASDIDEAASGTIYSPDYSYVARVTPEACFRAGILGRGSLSDFAGYLLVIIPLENKLVLAKLVLEGPETLDEMDLPLELGETYWLRLNLSGSAIEGKVWQGTVEDEPAEWMVSAVDDQYRETGRIGAFTCNFGSDEEPALTSVYYDDIQVTID